MGTGEGHIQSCVGVRARSTDDGGAVVEIFLDTPPHIMRGTVTPPLRGGRHLMECLYLSYVEYYGHSQSSW